jgi:putative endonuclease
MSKEIELGNKGESFARQHLEGKGYKILETNWRHGNAEIDIIAKDGDTLVFVEVKTRGKAVAEKPQEAVGQKKRQLMVRAANAYTVKIQHDWEIRFDVVAIVYYQNPPKIEHIEDAFFPDWTWKV